MESTTYASQIALFKGQIDDATTDVNQAMRDAQKGDMEAASKLGDLQATLSSLRDQLGKAEKEGMIADQNAEAEEQRKEDASYKKELEEKFAQAEAQRSQDQDLKFLDAEDMPKALEKAAEAITAPTAATAVAGNADTKKPEEKPAVKATTASSEAST